MLALLVFVGLTMVDCVFGLCEVGKKESLDLRIALLCFVIPWLMELETGEQKNEHVIFLPSLTYIPG